MIIDNPNTRDQWSEAARTMYDFMDQGLEDYFWELNKHYKGPIAMFYAIEFILQNPNLCTEKAFSVIRGHRGLSEMESYAIDAVSYVRRQNQYWWRFEGAALRRWSWARRGPYTVHEAFWALFLHRFIGTPNGTIAFHTDRLFERKTLIDPSALFDTEYNRVFACNPAQMRIIDSCMFVTMKQVFDTLNTWRSR